MKTPSSSTAADVLQRLQEHTTLLEDNALDIISKPRDEKSSAALVNFALLSHILANTSAFSTFEVRLCPFASRDMDAHTAYRAELGW